MVETAVALASFEEGISPEFEAGSIQEFIKEFLLGGHKLSPGKSDEETKLSTIPHSNRDPESSRTQMYFYDPHPVKCGSEIELYIL